MNRFLDYFEEIPTHLQLRDGIKIRNVCKVWKNSEGKNVIAVDEVTINFVEGEVVALLGQNGAGKSSFLSILNGSTNASSGRIYVFGLDLEAQPHQVFKILGVCPQRSSLYPYLSPMEHLILFLRLKGVPETAINQSAADLLAEVGLLEEKHSPLSCLSEGQLRILSIAIAFCGSPKVVLLDEPTVSMDLRSRRRIWKLIRKWRRSCVVILSTNQLEEADLLADRIAIMSHGSIVCFGTSHFLKSRYGVGYSLVLTANTQDSNLRKIRFTLEQNLSNFQVLSSQGNEVLVQIPFEESPKFSSLFEAFDVMKSEHSISSYSISVTTLEEVFFKVAADPNFRKENISDAPVLVKQLSSREIHQKKYIESPSAIEDASFDNALSDFLSDLKRSTETSGINLFFRHLFAMLYKRSHHARKERFLWIYLGLLPAINILFALLVVTSIYSSNYPSLILDSKQFGLTYFASSNKTSLDISIMSSNLAPYFLKANLCQYYLNLIFILKLVLTSFKHV